ncbi:MAG: sigma-70 family RNA polymerase sigma factor [Phycisphaerales bacterium]|nr:sigma-70 family RNA polymerase sigma factor [Phycisphaerales bacterium]
MMRSQPRPSGTGTSSETDEALIERCLANDDDAWRQLVDRYTPLVYSIPSRMRFDREIADEVFQEVFAILVRKLPGLDNRRGLPKWVMTTTERVCRRMIRRRRLDPLITLPALPLLADDDDAPFDGELLGAVAAALGELGGPCERLLTAMYRQGGERRYEDLASELDMPVGSLGPTRSRCLRKLLSILERRGWPPET